MSSYNLILKSIILESLCIEYEYILDKMEEIGFKGNLFAFALEVSKNPEVLNLSPYTREMLFSVMFSSDDIKLIELIGEDEFEQCETQAKQFILNQV